MKKHVSIHDKFCRAGFSFNHKKAMLPIILAIIASLFSVSFGQTRTSKTNLSNNVVKPPNARNVLSGMISDNFGEAVSGVELKLSRGGKRQSFSAISDDRGNYRFRDIPDGIYTLEVKPKTGYRNYKSVNIRIKNGGESQFDIALKSIGKRPPAKLAPNAFLGDAKNEFSR